MRVAQTIQEFLATKAKWIAARGGRMPSIGFVPTMGYLHQGHLSLVQSARKANDLVVASIFVNPTQFAPTDDLDAYPRDLERDSKLLSEHVDILFTPRPSDMYPQGASTWVNVDGVDTLEGASRPGHFRGVATVLTKFFNIVQPDNSYFGQKDAIQCVVVQKMARDLNFHTNIVVCPTLREPNGLAMSTRNMYLSAEEREKAGIIFKSLEQAKAHFKSARTAEELIKIVSDGINSEPIMELQYVSIASTFNGEELKGDLGNRNEVLLSVSAFCKGSMRKTRLIDNFILKR